MRKARTEDALSSALTRHHRGESTTTDLSADLLTSRRLLAIRILLQQRQRSQRIIRRFAPLFRKVSEENILAMIEIVNAGKNFH